MIRVRSVIQGLVGMGFLVVALAVAVSPAFAQSNSVTLTGIVVDKSGAVLPAVDVTATNTATGITKSAKTDQAGRYTILNVDPGTYDVQTQITGFATTVRRNQVFYVGQTITLDFSLELASVAQTVEVQAESPTSVSTTESVVSRVIEPQELDNLPTISRSFTDLATLSPGVQVATTSATGGNSGGAISIGDAANYQTGYIVDGTASEETFLGGQFLNFAEDWIQEFSLISQQAPAEYGGAAGGFVNAVTRSGGNNFHGRGYGFFQNAALNATPKFLPTQFPNKPPQSLQRIGGMAGGPIKKDKLFFFGGYEYFHNLTSVPVNVPAAFVGPASTSGVFPQTARTSIAMGKIDYQANANNRFTGRFNYEHDHSVNSGVGASGTSNKTLGNGSISTTNAYIYQGVWDRTISADRLNSLLFNYNRTTGSSFCNYALAVGNYPLYPGQAGSTIAGDPTGYWAQETYSQAGVVTGCSGNVGIGPTQSERSTSINDAFSFTHGNQTIKVGGGADFEQSIFFGVRNNYNGQYAINGQVPFNPATPATFPISNLVIFEGGNGVTGSLLGPIFSAFAEDSAKVRPTLTLNIGIRYDVSLMNTWFTHRWITPNAATQTVVPLLPLNNDYGNVAPRFGFAWTPFHDNGKTVIRGGLGVFYDENHTGFWNGYFLDGIKIVPNGADNLNSTRASLNPYCLGSVNCSTGTIPANVFVGSTGATQLNAIQTVQYILAYDLATYTLPNFAAGTYQIPGGPAFTITSPKLPSGALAPTTGGAEPVDQNFKTPGEVQISAGMAHQFGTAINASVDYVFVKAYQQTVLRNINISQSGQLLNPAYGEMSGFGNGGYFRDQNMRMSFSYRDRRGDSAQVAYTLGWAFDNDYSGYGINSRTIPQTDPYNYSVDYGPSVNDARNVLNISGALKAPWGIQLSPIFRFTSALPYTATTTATVVPGCLADYNQCYPVNASGVPYTKDSLRGANTISLNARLSKTFRLGEKRSAIVFFEGYNLLNRSNYGVNFQGNVASAAFMQPTALATAKRQLQLGARFDF